MDSIFKALHSTMKNTRMACFALALGVCGALTGTAANAQATAGTVFGSAPAGQHVTVQGNGAHRHATANARGRYSIGSLPMGTYTVILEKDDKVVDTRKNIPVSPGRGAEVDFACEYDHCAAQN